MIQMCGYFCIGFIDFMLKDRGTQYYTNIQIYFFLMNIKRITN